MTGARASSGGLWGSVRLFRGFLGGGVEKFLLLTMQCMKVLYMVWTRCLFLEEGEALGLLWSLGEPINTRVVEKCNTKFFVKMI